MSELFDGLKEGLNEAIEVEQGKIKAKRVHYNVAPVRRFDSRQIKAIRDSSGMTQSVFALFMGVSNKTVEAWERGTNQPTGPACRLLSILAESKLSCLPFVS